MPSFSYTVQTNERSPLTERIAQSENIGPFKSSNIQGPFMASKLDRIARRSGSSENSPGSTPEKEAGKSETEAAVEAAVNLLEKCALAARARSRHMGTPEDEAEAAEESAVCLVRACAAAAVKHSGKPLNQGPLSKRDATKLMLQARVADLEKEIAQSKVALGRQDVDKADWKQQCEDIYHDAVASYEQKVEPFLRRAQNPFEPADQHQVQVRLTEVQQRIAESKKLLRKKQDCQNAAPVKEQLKQHETVMHGLVGELTSVLSSHAQRRANLEEQLETAVREHSERAGALQQQLQQTIQDNLRSRDELAAEMDEPLTGCDQKRVEIEKAVEEIEAELLQ